MRGIGEAITAEILKLILCVAAMTLGSIGIPWLTGYFFKDKKIGLFGSLCVFFIYSIYLVIEFFKGENLFYSLFLLWIKKQILVYLYG